MTIVTDLLSPLAMQSLWWIDRPLRNMAMHSSAGPRPSRYSPLFSAEDIVKSRSEPSLSDQMFVRNDILQQGRSRVRAGRPGDVSVTERLWLRARSKTLYIALALRLFGTKHWVDCSA